MENVLLPVELCQHHIVPAVTSIKSLKALSATCQEMNRIVEPRLVQLRRLRKLDEDGDWGEAFAVCEKPSGADPTREDYNFSSVRLEAVKHVFAMRTGENDGQDWLVAGTLEDGRYFFVSAGCDYTGWQCRSGGQATVATSLEELVKYGLTDEARTAFRGIPAHLLPPVYT